MEYRDDITAEYIRSRLDLDPETGVLTWLYHPEMPKNWNAIFPGKAAGSNWHNGRVVISIKDIRYKAHRLVWLHYYGEWPARDVDHIDRNPANNSIANLRLATEAENQHNTPKQTNNTSGHKGVMWRSDRKRWFARIGVNGKYKYLGSYRTKEEAAEAYRKAAEEHHGEFARVE